MIPCRAFTLRVRAERGLSGCVNGARPSQCLSRRCRKSLENTPLWRPSVGPDDTDREFGVNSVVCRTSNRDGICGTLACVRAETHALQLNSYNAAKAATRSVGAGAKQSPPLEARRGRDATRMSRRRMSRLEAGEAPSPLEVVSNGRHLCLVSRPRRRFPLCGSTPMLVSYVCAQGDDIATKNGTVQVPTGVDKLETPGVASRSLSVPWGLIGARKSGPLRGSPASLGRALNVRWISVCSSCGGFTRFTASDSVLTHVTEATVLGGFAALGHSKGA